MAIYRAPGVFFNEAVQSLGSTSQGYNRTAVIGPAQLYTVVSNLELTKSKTITPKGEIIKSNVTPWLKQGTTEVTVGSFVIWKETEQPAEGTIEVDLVKAHWIGKGTPQVGSFVILVDDGTSYGYKESVEGVVGSFEVVATIEGNGFDVSSEEIEGAMKIIEVPADVDVILLPTGTSAQQSDILSITGIGNIAGFYNYSEGIDYTIDENKTKITWISENKPSAGSVFYITYKLNKSEARGDFNPVLLFNQTAIAELYGPEYLNGVVQPLTLGADLVLEGQTLLGGGVYCCQVTEDSDAAYKVAIDKMMKVDVQTIIILKQDSISLRNYLIQNIETCSSALYGKERTTFITPNGDINDDSIIAQREGLMNDRVTYFANKKVTIELTDAKTQDTEKVELDAIYAMCNIAGIEGNPDYTYSEPLLQKTLSSRITLVDNQIFDPSQRNYLCSNYLSALDFNENTNLTQIFDIFTTDSENVITETRAVRRVTDLIRKELRRQLKVYVGKKNVASTASSCGVKVQSILSNFIEAGEIKDYRNVVAGFNAKNPKQLDVSFTYLPIFEVKWVQVSISINID